MFATCAGLSFQSPSAAHVRTTLEKRASVLDGALRRNPSSIKLRIAQLQLAEQLQEHDYVDSLWKKAIEKCDGTQCTTSLRSISILLELIYKLSSIVLCSDVQSNRAVLSKPVRSS